MIGTKGTAKEVGLGFSISKGGDGSSGAAAGGDAEATDAKGDLLLIGTDENGDADEENEEKD